MKFLIGENLMSQFERATYRGGIGLYYNDTLGGIITFAVVALILILAVIGLFSLLGIIFFGKHRKKKDTTKK